MPPPRERPIAAGVRYEARSFPLDVRVRPPDDAWAGAQWKTSSHGKPAFGWIALGRLPAGNPRGLITVETGFAPTPSPAATLARLRSAGPEVTFGRTTRVTLAGYAGWQLAGRVSGHGAVLVPFSPKTAGGRPPDSHSIAGGEVFRVIVLDVRGKSVVLYLESFRLPPKQFPAFLAAAGRILRSLEFPA